MMNVLKSALSLKIGLIGGTPISRRYLKVRICEGTSKIELS